MLLVTGNVRRSTAAFGCPRKQRIGHRIEMDVGFGNLTTDGHGFPTSLGVGLHITTVAGLFATVRGAGGLVRYLCPEPTIQCGRQHTSHSSGSELAPCRSALVSATLVGCRSDQRTVSIRGMDAATTR